jgi:hypothetical protein
VKSGSGDIGLPLLRSPVSDNISERGVLDNVEPVLLGRKVQACPEPGTGGFSMTRKGS